MQGLHSESLGRVACAPLPKNVGRLISEYVDRKKKDTFFTTNLL